MPYLMDIKQKGSAKYSSKLQCSEFEKQLLIKGNIIDPSESPREMIERIVETIFSVEKRYGTPFSVIKKMKEDFGNFLDEKFCVMSTPVMTNAGRYKNRPLSACTVPYLDLKELKGVRKIVEQLHIEGMGTGFNFDEVEDPIQTLNYLNEIAVTGSKSGKENRPVGNIAIISVNHHKILDFIYAKSGLRKDFNWKFNISVNATDDFMIAAKKGKHYSLTNGKKINAKKVLDEIIKCASNSGDPGLIFIDRLNRDNPTPIVGNYTSTAPCGEVGLTAGESCQFGYLNLAKFVIKTNSENLIDYYNLEKAVRLMTRVLDNALDISIDNYSQPENKKVMLAKRKIGIGVCGLADMLIKLKIPYGDKKATQTCNDVISFINYYSKIESHELAKLRGSFGAMKATEGCRYNEDPGFLEKKYGSINTKTVSGLMWQKLGEKIRKTGYLRNASTIALPPTGRSGITIGASTGIEPIFSIVNYDGTINQSLVDDLRDYGIKVTKNIKKEILSLGSIKNILGIPEKIKKLYRTAVEIPALEHLSLVAKIQEVVDESISKTINVPEDIKIDDLKEMYTTAYDLGLKGITIFRNGSRLNQPRSLSKKPSEAR